MSDTTSGGSSERPDLSGEPPASVWPPPPDSGALVLAPTYPVTTNAVVILVLGIVSLLFCGLLGIAPWVMGNNSLRAIAQGLANPTERTMVNGGRICGIIGVGLSCAGVLLNLGMLAFGYYSSGKSF